ncbi:membrane protein [Dethiosulfatarculus sandiegensis]|uniref:Membrane protein n=1 Tax=Dethiosulfatarculus sandiegensis TaxID=1429043 RepID=A0A0D2K0K6_9BACT|nr:membrane protein [Dethiosulfatarculus sandiegensis]
MISTHGYWALFLGGFIEGETFFLLGGVAAGQGLLSPWGVGLSAMAGGFLGDQFFFLLGLWKGEKFIKRSSRLAAKAGKIKKPIQRHAVALILLSRFLYGLRAVIPLACGASGIRPARFMGLNLISAILWSLTFGGLGYLLGETVLSRLDNLEDLKIQLAIILLILITTLFLGRLFGRRMLAGFKDKATWQKPRDAKEATSLPKRQQKA